MAGIDKIYGTQAQYRELRDWLHEHGDPHGASGHLYPEKGYGDDLSTGPRPISNFPRNVDKYLWKHCKLDWVITALRFQYGPRGPR